MLSVLLRFAVLGSFVGGGVFITVRNLAASSGFPSAGEIAIAVALALPAAMLASFLSLPLGLFPAAITGVCYWYLLDKYTKRNPSPLLRMALGGALGLLASLIFGLPLSFSDAPGAYGLAINLLSWAGAGTFAGGLSALAVRDATYVVAFKRREVSGGA
jgi:MFS superfamily sulfate permease-like transporter